MTDTITDSFCERCGTRYTFEKAAKRRRLRLGRVRVLTRGLTTFVANDGLPMAEAMAAARDDEERATLSSQLDAFHKTFNFCMTCRQYTCPSCWNETAAECLTCAPDRSREVLPPAFPDVPTAGPTAGQDGEAVAAAPWPSADLDRGAAVEEPAPAVAAAGATAEITAAAAVGAAETVAAAPDDETPALAPDGSSVESAAAPHDGLLGDAPALDVPPSAGTAADLTATELAEIESALALARGAFLRAEAEAHAEVAVGAAAGAAAEVAVDADAAAAAHAEVAVDADAAAEPAPVDADDGATVLGADLAAAAALAPAAALAVEAASSVVAAAPDDKPGVEPAPGPEPAGPVEPTEQAAVARDQTRSLLRRFRPGRGVSAPAGTTQAAGSAAGREAEAPLAAVQPQPQPVPAPERSSPAAAAEAVVGSPTPGATPTTVAASPTPDVAPPALVAAPVPARPQSDTIQQPTWQMVAPDVSPDVAPGETASPGTGIEPTPPAAWPTTPGWSSQPPVQPRTPGPDASPWAARLASSRPEIGGIWAASSREVLGAPAPPGATPAVQACVSCGLSLSATARFCRRCGARQG